MTTSRPWLHACAVFLAVSALACSHPRSTAATSTPPPVPERWPGISLPGATNVLDLDDAPVIVVDQAHVLVDGQIVGDLAPILASHRMQRIDGLFTEMKARYVAAKHAQGDAPFHGQCNLVIDASTTAVVVKSVFQTAAFAGFPYPSFVVRRASPAAGASMYGLLPANAQVPGPPRAEPIDDGHAAPSIAPPSMREGNSSVSGRLAPEIIRRIVRQNFGALRLCYEKGLARDPKLAGQVAVSFTIDRDGHVSRAGATPPAKGAPRIDEPDVEACVVARFASLTFPAPEGGIVTVVYPIVFNPGD
jgi:TonB family protein